MTDLAVVVSPQWPCPACGCTATVQTSSGVAACDVDAPEPGDLVVCIGCAAICILTPAMQLRLFDDADLAFYTLDDLARVSRAATELRAAYERRN
jgi:hypothetical protein